MFRALFWVSAATCALLGIVHTALTPVLYTRLTPGAVWFAGAGLGLVLLPLLNIAAWRRPSSDRLVRRLALGANVGMAAFGVLAVRAVPEPQAYLVLAAILGILVASLGLERA